MKDYSFSELGMLIGAAAGGTAAVIGFSATDSPLFFMLAAVGIAVGIAMGNMLERRRTTDEKNKAAAKGK